MNGRMTFRLEQAGLATDAAAMEPADERPDDANRPKRFRVIVSSPQWSRPMNGRMTWHW